MIDYFYQTGERTEYVIRLSYPELIAMRRAVVFYDDAMRKESEAVSPGERDAYHGYRDDTACAMLLAKNATEEKVKD